MARVPDQAEARQRSAARDCAKFGTMAIRAASKACHWPASGRGGVVTYLRHILPAVAATLIILMTLVFPEVILLESALSFLGLGVQPPLTSLGTMIGPGRDYLTRAPWIPLAPALTIVLTTLAISVVGDWLRDRLDPSTAGPDGGP